MVRGALSDDHLIQLRVVTGTLNAQKYQDKILKSGVRSPLDSPDGPNMVLRDDIARPHRASIIKKYKNQQNIASLPRPSLLLDLNPLEHVWDKLKWRFKLRTSRIKSIVNFARLYGMSGTGLMSWTHVPSELNDENMPSCYSTVWRLYTK